MCLTYAVAFGGDSRGYNPSMIDDVASAELVMPSWSAYAGQPFDLSERRPLTVVSEDEQAVLVSGFYHQAAFWKAVVPKQGVAAISGQRLNFSKPWRGPDGATRSSVFFLNHVQARVQMRADRPLLLYAADAEPAGEPSHRIADFSYSVEAVGPRGRKWNLTDALLGNLAVVHRFLSTEEVAFERIVRARMTVVQSPPLPLDGELLDTMLHEAIRQSAAAGLEHPYFMFRLPFSATNCTSEPLKLLDGVLRTPHWRSRFYRFPVHPRGYLKLRGLWQSGQTVPTLNEQMADWIASDEVRQRRHTHREQKKQHPRSGRSQIRLVEQSAAYLESLAQVRTRYTA